MSKSWLIVIGIYLLLMGIVGLFVASMPNWHAWIDLVIGIIGLIVGATDKGKKTSQLQYSKATKNIQHNNRYDKKGNKDALFVLVTN